MPVIRIPKSAETLLPFCRRHEDAAENACFDTYADLMTFAASCGFHRMNARCPTEPKEFLSSIYPIDVAVFKNQQLFPNLLLIALGSEGKYEIARDEERVCRSVEAFADVGFKYLAHGLGDWTPARFHLEVASILYTQADQKAETTAI